MSELSIRSRAQAARELLLGWDDDEYERLPPKSKASIQDAIEHLYEFEESVVERGRKK